ncbi:MAG: XRE family transcriptional regulator [Symploca sp. SIO2B6]|nr:XRE family transcriptional regulator [Symploca sp. SIO2B6]
MAEHPNIGSSLDDFLDENEILAEVRAIALKRVLAWQITQAMAIKGLSKTGMASAMETTPSVLEDLLDPENIMVTLQTLDHAATVLGKQLRIELVDAS